MLLKQLGLFDEALKYYNKAIELNPKNDTAYHNKGQIVILF